jgi:hypothetical protein|tara:strand:+ start:116 stop:469 length:354 start_codon:yes stop_codon:yes gene_type:complete
MKESISAYSKQKAIIKKALRNAEFENIEISNGYYYFSGFATKNNKRIYFSISDVRHFSDNEVLIRTARDYKDYTGGSNCYADLNVEDIQKLANSLTTQNIHNKIAEEVKEIREKNKW